jgi:preprotein translocase subunit SecG
MQNIIIIIQVVIAIILVILVLLQNKGGGLSGVFGGSGGDGNIFRTKRGIEKKLHYATIIFAILFLGISIANLFINS